MPEGDTIHRTANTLRRAIEGAKITAFESPLPKLADADLDGHDVARVYARGKNLLIELDDGRCLHSHMKMEGSWHVYRTGERWKVGAHRARVALHTARYVAVCFDAPVVALLTPFQLRAYPPLVELGPDLIADALVDDVIIQRFRRHDDDPIGVAVMNQSIVAGIGNVYKAEVLFIERVDPFVPVHTLDDATLLRVVHRAAELLKKNLTGGKRRTRFALDPGYEWVYGRSGKPCRACGRTVRMKRQGAQMRSTYFCPHCQGVSLE
ncbi:MAG: DNA-formamidopyrimidine glycosylase family protein [Deltaproteobacteria bacterium]